MWGLFVRPVTIMASLALLVFAGCEPTVARFRLNMALKRKLERKNLVFTENDQKVIGQISAEQVQDIADILTAMFGTPDDPKMPPTEDPELARVVDLKLVKQAAGRVASDAQGRPVGLYREHCVHCHGITGDGAGPTAAFLNPYPRDYRQGLYKFKSTKKGSKPTHEDLKTILNEGIPGTAMPSFKLLPEQDVEALIHYVRYLSIRGETERLLFDHAATELAAEDAKTSPTRFYKADPEKEPDVAKQELAGYLEMAQGIMEAWKSPVSVAVVPPMNAEKQTLVSLNPNDQASIARGRALFYGPIANCYSCHGESGLGDGQRDFYDDWSGQWIEKDDPHGAIRSEYVALGALPPRNLIPRNLRAGVFRGGRRPIDIYWRIVNGIDGAQMPAVPLKTGPDVKGLTNDDIWDLINYVRTMPYESINQQAIPESHVVRERM